MGGDEDAGRPGDGPVNQLQRFCIAQIEIVDALNPGGHQDLTTFHNRLRRGVTGFDGLNHGFEGFVEGERLRAIVSRQIFVAGTGRQPVCVTHQRRANDLGGDIKVAHHSLDHQQLLIVLFSEHGDMGEGLQQQFCHHNRYPAKKVRAAVTAQPLRDAVHLNAGREMVWIHFIACRRIDQMTAPLGHHGGIIGLLPWIGVKVFMGRKLRRVDKDGDDDAVGFCLGFVNQAHMPDMKRPHGRHQSNLQTLLLPNLNLRAQVFDCSDNFDVAAHLFIHRKLLPHDKPNDTHCKHNGPAPIIGVIRDEGGEMAPHILVLGNEKGGSGKSTTAMHVTIALLKLGASVHVIDLDARQRSLTRYLENREGWLSRNGVKLGMPTRSLVPRAEFDTRAENESDELARFEAAMGEGEAADFIVIDCPGADTHLARLGHSVAHTLITPMNDSFVDFDLIGTIDPDTYEVVKPSLYAELVWEGRKRRMMARQASIDWVILRNRLQQTDAHNKRRVGAALDALAPRIGFRVAPGFGERVIYRELFPNGLTLLDLTNKAVDVSLTMSHLAARNELRALIEALEIEGVSERAHEL